MKIEIVKIENESEEISSKMQVGFEPLYSLSCTKGIIWMQTKELTIEIRKKQAEKLVKYIIKKMDISL